MPSAATNGTEPPGPNSWRGEAVESGAQNGQVRPMRQEVKITAVFALCLAIIGVVAIGSFLGIEEVEARGAAAIRVTRQGTWMVAVGLLLSLLALTAVTVAATRSMRLGVRAMRPGGADRRWPEVAIQYALAVTIVELATLARWWLEQAFGPMPLFITWYPAVLIVATMGGGGPGAAATILSALAADYWFIAPQGQFLIHAPNDAVATGIFTGTGLFTSVLAERLHRARWAEAVSATQEQELALLDMGNLAALDLDHRIVRWSQGCRRLYGYDAQEAQGRLTHELLKTRLQRPQDPIQDVLRQHGYWEGQATRRRKDGTEVAVALLLALRRDPEGRPSAVLEVSTDVTERKRAEEQMRLHLAVLESTANAIVITSRDGTIQWVNPSFTRLTGYSAEEAIGRNPRVLNSGHHDAAFFKSLWETILAGRVWHGEVINKRKDGNLYTEEMTITPVTGADGAIAHFIAIKQDVTARKQAEVALQQAAANLERSNQDLEQFAYVASHDLQEPLRMVTGFMDLLKSRYEGRLDAKADTFIAHAVGAANRMRNLIDGLLAYSRIGHEGETELMTVAAAVEGALANLQARIAESGATITCDALPPVTATGAELTHLFQNLIGNAIKFSRPGVRPEVHISAKRVTGHRPLAKGEEATAHSSLQSNDQSPMTHDAPKAPMTNDVFWLFSIRDNGIGIDPQFAERIFVIFQRLHTNDSYPGTGIGLAICKKIVERRGGKIWVESKAGNGSTFFFALPERGEAR